MVKEEILDDRDYKIFIKNEKASAVMEMEVVVVVV